MICELLVGQLHLPVRSLKDLLGGVWPVAGLVESVRMHLVGEDWMHVGMWNHLWRVHGDVAVLVDSLVDGHRLMMLHVRVVVVGMVHMIGHLLFVLVLMPHAAGVLSHLPLWIFRALAFENWLAYGNLLRLVVRAKVLV